MNCFLIWSSLLLPYRLGIQSEITPAGLFRSGVLFAVMKATWDQLMFYQNRFETKDLLHSHVFYLLQAMCAFIMANHLALDEAGNRWDRENNMVPFTLAATIARASTACMYSQLRLVLSSKTNCSSSSYENYFVAVMVSQTLAAALYLLPAVIQSTEHYYWLWWLCAIFMERSFVAVYVSFFTATPGDDASHFLPWHMGHLRHREVREAERYDMT